MLRQQRFDKGFQLLRQKKAQAALDIFLEQQKEDKASGRTNVDVSIHISRCYIELRQYDKAISLLKKCETISRTPPEKRDLYSTLSNYYTTKYFETHNKEFLTLAIQASQKIPAEFEVLRGVTYANLLHHDNQTNKAALVLNPLIEKFPNDKSVEITKARILKEKIDVKNLLTGESLEACLRYLKDLVHTQPNNREYTDRLDELLTKTDPVSENNPTAWLYLALAYEHQKRKDLAEKIFNKVINKHPTLWRAKIDYAVSLQKDAAWNESIIILENIIKDHDKLKKEFRPATNLEWLQIYHSLSIAYFEIGNYPKSSELSAKVLARDPNFAPGLSMSAKLMPAHGVENLNKAKIHAFEAARYANPERFENKHGPEAPINTVSNKSNLTVQAPKGWNMENLKKPYEPKPTLAPMTSRSNLDATSESVDEHKQPSSTNTCLTAKIGLYGTQMASASADINTPSPITPHKTWASLLKK